MVIVEIIRPIKWYQAKFSNTQAHISVPGNTGWNFLLCVKLFLHMNLFIVHSNK